jgi:hypothetical protein
MMSQRNTELQSQCSQKLGLIPEIILLTYFKLEFLVKIKEKIYQSGLGQMLVPGYLDLIPGSDTH